MQNYERAQFLAQGDFFYVLSAPEKIRVTVSKGGVYEVGQDAQIKSEKINGATVTVENLGEAGKVAIMVGFGEYVPPQVDEVAIKAMPAVEIASGQAVAVNDLPAVEIAAGQSVDVMPGKQINTYAGAMPLNVPQNSDRKGVIIKASSSNTGAIALGSFEIEAGEVITIHNSSEITLSGDVADKAQVLEF